MKGLLFLYVCLLMNHCNIVMVVSSSAIGISMYSWCGELFFVFFH